MVSALIGLVAGEKMKILPSLPSKNKAPASVGCVIPMVVAFALLNTEFGTNDHREDASHFNIYDIYIITYHQLSWNSINKKMLNPINFFLKGMMSSCSFWKYHRQKSSK